MMILITAITEIIKNVTPQTRFIKNVSSNAIEKGDYNPTIKLCIAICKALNKTLDELFWEE